MSKIDYINVSLELWGCVMSFVVAICLLVNKSKRDLTTKAYFIMIFINIGSLVFDACAYLFRGHLNTFSWWGIRISNFMAFFFNYLLLAVFAWYLISYLEHKAKVTRLPLYLVWTLCGLAVIHLVVNQFIPIWYYIDSNNEYHRLPFLGVSIFIGILGMVILGWLLMRYRHILDRGEKLAFWIYIIFPVIAMCIQSFLYGFVLLRLVNTVSLVIAFLFLQAEQGKRLSELENQLTQSCNSIMLSQIQPHFLNNALNTIQYLCETQPKVASRAIESLSKYLRSNMDSLTQRNPVPLKRDLEHLKNYLYIEKLRFPYIEIRYDMKCMDFSVPALTLQPLVENAIIHGVSQPESNGIITISSWDDNKQWYLQVLDNGAGFVTNTANKADGRSHLGLENTRSRLKYMCKGSLTVESDPGKGTRVTISIPKGETI